MFEPVDRDSQVLQVNTVTIRFSYPFHINLSLPLLYLFWQPIRFSTVLNQVILSYTTIIFNYTHMYITSF